MRKVGTRFVRIMSYPVLEGRSLADQMQEERFARLREIVGIFGAPYSPDLHRPGGIGTPSRSKC